MLYFIENKNYINYVCDDVLINELIDVANEYDLDYTDIFKRADVFLTLSFVIGVILIFTLSRKSQKLDRKQTKTEASTILEFK